MVVLFLLKTKMNSLLTKTKSKAARDSEAPEASRAPQEEAVDPSWWQSQRRKSVEKDAKVDDLWIVRYGSQGWRGPKGCKSSKGSRDCKGSTGRRGSEDLIGWRVYKGGRSCKGRSGSKGCQGSKGWRGCKGSIGLRLQGLEGP